jgi:phosphoribosylformylglycinamidine cyclo-ligase
MADSHNARYQDAGVNIDAGNQLIKRIAPAASASKRAGVLGALGGFGAMFDLKEAGYEDAILVTSTDGVGTKLKLAEMLNKHDSIGIDLVAMCVNDILVQGAEPLFFLDYFATGKLEIDVAEAVIKGIATGCTQAGCALVGGETAEMPGMYAPGSYDLAGFAVGAVARGHILPVSNIHPQDVIIGIASSGVHANGFSLVRKLIADHQLDLDAAPGFETEAKTLGEALLTPTLIYVQALLPLIQKGYIKALSHITGGGLSENIPRILPDKMAAKLDESAIALPPIFAFLQKLGNISDAEMRRTFNCGIGMALVVAPAQQAHVLRVLNEDAGLKAHIIGHIIAREKGDGVVYRQS